MSLSETTEARSMVASDSLHIPEVLDRLESRLETIEALLLSLTGKRKADPAWLSLEDASRIAGRTKRGVQHLIKREKERPDGFPLRTMHGKVHRKDFLAFLESLSSRNPGRGETVHQALENIRNIGD